MKNKAQIELSHSSLVLFDSFIINSVPVLSFICCEVGCFGEELVKIMPRSVETLIKTTKQIGFILFLGCNLYPDIIFIVGNRTPPPPVQPLFFCCD